MPHRKYRWSKTYESAEEELVNQLQQKNVPAERWSLDPFEERTIDELTSDLRMWCAEGSLTIDFGDRQYSMQPGDTMDITLPASYHILAGLNGCGCYEVKLDRRDDKS